MHPKITTNKYASMSYIHEHLERLNWTFQVKCDDLFFFSLSQIRALQNGFMERKKQSNIANDGDDTFSVFPRTGKINCSNCILLHLKFNWKQPERPAQFWILKILQYVSMGEQGWTMWRISHYLSCNSDFICINSIFM